MDIPESRHGDRSETNEGGSSEKAVLQSRETAVAAREVADRAREDAASIREEAVFVREEASEVRAELDALTAQLREANEHLIIANLRSQALAEDAEKANHLKDLFVAMVSHELRTPLNAVLGWARILGSKQLSADRAHHAIQAIERNAASLTLIIDDLLDVSRIIVGTLKLRTTPIDLVAATHDACDVAEPMAAARRIELVRPAAHASEEWVEADATRLQQAIGNLLANAVKFTPDGGRITVSVARAGDQVVVEIVDTGQGIDADFLPYVFERFRQFDSAASRPHGGLGLGLTIVRKIIGLHGGTVDASSEGKGRGSTFAIRLPILAAIESAEGSAVRERRTKPRARRLGASPDAAHPGDQRLDGLRILVVDDDVDGRTLTSLLLTDLGARVRVAASAGGARQLLSVERPDVLVSDVGMPGEDGYSLIRRLRQHEAEHGGFLPAIALTGYAGDEERSRILAAGFQAHVPKPLDPAQLATAIIRVARADQGMTET